MVRFVVLIILIQCCSCGREPEFVFPEAQPQVPKENRVALIELEEFESDDHGWLFEIIEPRDEAKFEGARATDLIASANHSLKIERLTHRAIAAEGFYDYAQWRINFTEVDIPRGAQIKLLCDIKLENVSGTGISLIVAVKRRGVRMGYVDSGWINGNGRILEFSSFGTLYPDINEPIDEIEIILRMEPVTSGTVYFDNVEVDLLY